MNENQCGYPVGEDDHPCRKRPVVEYQHRGETIYRCSAHDGRTVRDYAEENGWVRRELTVAA